MAHGDLIFTQIGQSDDAISAVTEGYRGARVNHVGITIENRLGTFVLEAFPPEVRLTNIRVHVNRSRDLESKPRYLIGRLKGAYRHLLPKAIQYGLSQRDVPYDKLYLTGEAALYCSELVVDMFKFANEGVEFFPEAPMSFKDVDTGRIHDSWIQYYDYFGMPVPQGEPGSNPGDLSKDSRVDIIEVVGPITGYVR